MDSNANGGENNDFDAAPDANNPITRNLRYGVKLQAEFQLEDNFDLDKGENDDVATVDPQVELAFAYAPNENVIAFVNFELSREFKLIEEGENDDRRTELSLDEAYLKFTRFAKDFSVQMGRQRFDDDREWLYDEKLDAIRLFFTQSGFDLELSISRGDVVRPDLLHRNKDKDEITNYIAYGQYAVDDDINVAAYTIFRDDQSPDRERPLFLGLRSIGELFGDLDYWVDLGLVRGKDDSTKLRGYGFDVGGTYTFDEPFDGPLKPYVTLGYAFGSGDSNPDNDTDKSFRQTGLQDNADRFGGGVSLQYYGEAFDPELSNMSIFTTGVGVRNKSKSSIDLVYHNYRLVKKSDELRDAAVEEDLDGDHKALGNEIDLVFGYREIKKLRAELALGYFMPGRAFPSDADDNAFFANFEISYSF